MEMPHLKSQTPKPHDHTENDLIMISPAVLDNRLRDFEEYQKLKVTLSGYIALALALIIPALTASFNDYSRIQGATIRGFFIAGFIFITIKVIASAIKIYRHDGHARSDLIRDLTEEKKNKK